jgi:hypothetical protein
VPGAEPLASIGVNWKKTLNDRLTRATGYQIQRASPAQAAPAPAPAPAARRRRPAKEERLVQAPAFILSTLRSGSTLLRVLIDSHSQLHSPVELHLRNLDVTVGTKWAAASMKEIGLDDRRLEYLLWDRLLDRELGRSGKRQIVNKTPNDVFIVDRILECWPDARFIFLLRHPGAIVRSRQNLRPGLDDSVETILKYGRALEKARQEHSGLTVRYEELTADPETHTRRVCEFLGVPWEPGMIEYGQHDHGSFKAGLGDWAGKIRTGQIQPPEPPPALEEIDPALRELCVAWGYLEPSALAAASS